MNIEDCKSVTKVYQCFHQTILSYKQLEMFPGLDRCAAEICRHPKQEMFTMGSTEEEVLALNPESEPEMRNLTDVYVQTDIVPGLKVKGLTWERQKEPTIYHDTDWKKATDTK